MVTPSEYHVCLPLRLDWETVGQTVRLSAELRRVDFCISQPHGPATSHNTFLATFRDHKQGRSQRS